MAKSSSDQKNTLPLLRIYSREPTAHIRSVSDSCIDICTNRPKGLYWRHAQVCVSALVLRLLSLVMYLEEQFGVE